MHTVNVEIQANKPYNYPIFIGNGILEKAGSYLKRYIKAKKLLIVSNQTVYSLYGEQVKKSLLAEGFNVEILLLPEGERHKNINSLEKIWTKAIQYKLERKDAIIAFGGGVTGDVTGFAAATYLRGIDFAQIPTTLLAQVDSSVGGKVAVNHQLGKNLIGNFYQPKIVIADTAVLSSLPLTELKVGLAEVLKYGFIEKTCGLNKINSSFIDFLEKNKDLIFSLNPSILEELVKYCCELKACVVNKDEKESGLRAILNFGHTIGHAIEKCYGYNNINHGEAVAIGMKGAFFIAGAKNLIDENYVQKSINLLDDYKMSYKIDKNFTPDDLYESMQVDKKVQAGKIRFILPVSPSEVRIFDDISKEEAITAIKTLY
ncbi:MAG TPA: 3-dehydroquinate synthase [Candidatus Gastranaerophilales bacterium]|nr:3-dehydroquinate synthase [Candidatus Gastranaerophilales bacterium]